MQRTALRRLRAKIESSYAADGTGTIADYFDLRFLTGAVNRTTAILPDESVTQRLFQRRLAELGHKSVSVEFSGNLCSTNEALEDGVTATKDSTSKVLEAICGGYNAGEGSAVASGASATGVTVSAGDGAQFIAGTLIGVESETVAGRIGAVTRVDTRSTDALTFGVALSGTPSVAKKLYNSQLIYAKPLPASASTWLQFLIEGEDVDDKYLALGCQAASLTLGFPLGGLATWGFTANGAKWLHDDDFATPIGTGLVAGTLDGSNPIPCKGGSVVLTPCSVTTRTTPHIAELTLNPGISWGPAPSHNGTEGVAQMVMMRTEQPTLSMLIEKADESWDDVLTAQTKYQLIAQFGNVPGATLALDCPTMQLIAQPTEEDQNGIAYWRLTWGLLEDEITDDSGSDIERAPWRLGRF